MEINVQVQDSIKNPVFKIVKIGAQEVTNNGQNRQIDDLLKGGWTLHTVVPVIDRLENVNNTQNYITVLYHILIKSNNK